MDSVAGEPSRRLGLVPVRPPSWSCPRRSRSCPRGAFPDRARNGRSSSRRRRGRRPRHLREVVGSATPRLPHRWLLRRDARVLQLPLGQPHQRSGRTGGLAFVDGSGRALRAAPGDGLLLGQRRLIAPRHRGARAEPHRRLAAVAFGQLRAAAALLRLSRTSTPRRSGCMFQPQPWAWARVSRWGGSSSCRPWPRSTRHTKPSHAGEPLSAGCSRGCCRMSTPSR